MFRKLKYVPLLVRKGLFWVKKHPFYTTIIGMVTVAAVIGLILLLKAVFPFFVIGGLLLWLNWDTIFKAKAQPNVNYIIEAVFYGLLEYYFALHVRHPRIIAEINPTFVSIGNMSFYVIKQHPNVSVDFDILDEGRFLLQDAVNLYAMQNNCVITVYSVTNDGGYIKIGACFGMLVPSQPASATVDTFNSDFLDEDF